MYNRPRCCDWTALATQQLRLRSLVKISGHNIVCSPKCQLYYTLHSTAMSTPFFTSEKVDSRCGEGNIEWTEITCQKVLKSQARSVCIRVWEHKLPAVEGSRHDRKSVTIDEDDDGRTSTGSTVFSGAVSIGPATIAIDVPDDKTNSTTTTTAPTANDKMLFIWGIYFSGLIPIMKRSDLKFHSNTLVFQMHGGYFASPESLTLPTIRQQLILHYDLEQGVGGGGGSGGGEGSTLKLNSYSNQLYSKEYIKSEDYACDNSNLLGNLIRSDGIPILDGTTRKDQSSQVNSLPHSSQCFSPGSSPPENDIKIISPTELDKDKLLQMIRVRYLKRSFLNSEIRSSYNLDKLLSLQEKQRKYKQKSEHAQELIDNISVKSAFCLNLDLISSKGHSYNYHQASRGSNFSMGRTLNRLLFQSVNLKPEDVLKAQELRRQIELARFRCQLLSQEKERTKTDFRHLEKKLGELHDYIIEQESLLMSSYRNLSREKNALEEQKVNLSERINFLLRTQKLLRQRRTQLCRELYNIYPITSTSKGELAINNVILPRSDHLISEFKAINADQQKEIIAPLSISVALGYVAHVVNMCSIVHNIPLRNPIKHEGSRSRIMDIIKEIPNASREYPLYYRTSPIPKAVSYAIFLLNQNLMQLNFHVHNVKCDLRETLLNTLQLIRGASPSIPDMLNSVLDSQIWTAVSKSTGDLHVPITLIDPANNVPKLSESLDSSCSDDVITQTTDKQFSNSESGKPD